MFIIFINFYIIHIENEKSDLEDKEFEIESDDDDSETENEDSTKYKCCYSKKFRSIE